MCSWPLASDMFWTPPAILTYVFGQFDLPLYTDYLKFSLSSKTSIPWLYPPPLSLSLNKLQIKLKPFDINIFLFLITNVKGYISLCVSFYSLEPALPIAFFFL